MASSYVWSIKKIVSNKSTGAILNAEVYCLGVDSVIADTAYRASSKVTFNPDVSSTSFIPFDSVKESDVIKWCQDFVEENGKSLKNNLQSITNSEVQRLVSFKSTRSELLPSGWN